MNEAQVKGLQNLNSSSSVMVTAVTSGKGGVGKTNVSINLAVGLAQKGRSVVLFDADLGLANVDVALGLKSNYDIRHVLNGERTLEEILIPGPAGIKVIPASSGVSGLADLSTQELAGLINTFSELSFPVDNLIVDTGAGIDSTVLSFASACQEIVVVVCDEPSSLTDAYALIKVLNKEKKVNRFQILANMVEDDAQGRDLFQKVSTVTDRFLVAHLGYLGHIPWDDYMKKAVQKQRAVVELYPRSKVAVAFKQLVDQVDSFSGSQNGGGVSFNVGKLAKPDFYS